MTLVPWIGFIVLVLIFLALDLGVFHRESRIIGVREALGWTGVWIVAALLFAVAVYFLYERDGLSVAVDVSGRRAAMEYITGYVIEKSLSLDNVFVIAMIFSHFAIPAAYQHRILFWGILGALAMRGAMIGAGSALLHRFGWLTYGFGAFLLFTAVRMLVTRHDTLEPEKSPLVRALRRVLPVSDRLDGERFFTRVDGRRAATPLFLVLLLVESTDLMFAVDSVPAIFAVTQDPFLVFTSNVFAILGLRSLYFALAGAMARFRYLKASLVFVLAFVGVKMLLVHHAKIPTWVSLSFILGILSVGVAASMVAGARDPARLRPPPTGTDRPE